MFLHYFFQLSVIRTLLIHCDTLPDQGKSVLNVKNKNEATALHTALQLGHMDIFDRLLEAGADSTIQVSECKPSDSRPHVDLEHISQCYSEPSHLIL